MIIEKYLLSDDVNLFGMQVTTFPLGIGEVFTSLMKMIPNGLERAYYGLSWMNNDGAITYIAAAEQKAEGEAEKYHCEKYVVEKGEYLSISVKDWRNKLDCIKDVFHELMQDNRADTTAKCIEWYKDDNEMFCMIKMLKQPEIA